MKRKRWGSNFSTTRRNSSSKRDGRDPFFEVPSSTRPCPQQSPVPHSEPDSPQFEIAASSDWDRIDADDAIPDAESMENIEREEDEEDCGSQKETVAICDMGSVRQDERLLPLQWTTIACMLATTGTKRFTEEGYDMFSSFLNWLSTDARLPSTATVKRSIRASARYHAFARSETMSFAVDFAKSGAKAGVGNFSSDTTAPVMIVKPSEWARLDLGTHLIQVIVEGKFKGSFEEGSERCTQPCFRTIEDAPIVRNRSETLEYFKMRNSEGGLSSIREDLEVVVQTVDSPSLRLALRKTGLHVAVDKTGLTFDAKITHTFISRSLDGDLFPTTELNCNKNAMKRKAAKAGIRSSSLTSPPFVQGILWLASSLCLMPKEPRVQTLIKCLISYSGHG